MLLATMDDIMKKKKSFLMKKQACQKKYKHDIKNETKETPKQKGE